MKLVYDAAKDIANIAKHGISLAESSKLEWDDLLAKPDTRADYGETRMIGFAPISDRLYCVVFTDRDGERRVISLRKANSREVRNYANQD